MQSPNFDRLPTGTKAQFEARLARLPLHRVRTRIDFDAVWENEDRFNCQFCAAHHLSEDDRCALGTWHLRAVHELLEAARPDLKPHRGLRLPRGVLVGPARESIGPDGSTTIVQTMYRRDPPTRLDRLAWALKRFQPTFMAGWGCWFGNRWSGVRGVWVNHRAAQFRRTEAS